MNQINLEILIIFGGLLEKEIECIYSFYLIYGNIENVLGNCCFTEKLISFKIKSQVSKIDLRHFFTALYKNALITLKKIELNFSTTPLVLFNFQ